MSTTFEHISVFEKAPAERQLRAMVEFVLESPFFGEQEQQKLSWRIQKYAAKMGVPYHIAAAGLRDAIRQVVESRVEKIL